MSTEPNPPENTTPPTGGALEGQFTRHETSPQTAMLSDMLDNTAPDVMQRTIAAVNEFTRMRLRERSIFENFLPRPPQPDTHPMPALPYDSIPPGVTEPFLDNRSLFIEVSNQLWNSGTPYLIPKPEIKRSRRRRIMTGRVRSY